MRQKIKHWLLSSEPRWRKYLVSGIGTLLIMALCWIAPVHIWTGPIMLAVAVYLAFQFGFFAGLLSVVLTLATTRPALSILAAQLHRPEPQGPTIILVAAFVVVGLIGSLCAELVERSRRKLDAEKKLHKSTLASISDAVIHTSAEGHIKYLNPAAALLLGITPEAALGQHFESIVDVRDEQDNRSLTLIHDARVAGATLHLSTGQLLIGSDGRQIPVETSIAPVRSEAGELNGVVLTLRNCTEQRRIAKVTSERLALQSRLERIAAVVPGALLEFQAYSDDSFGLSYASRSFVEILGIEPESCRANCAPMLACVHPDDVDYVCEVIQRAIAATTPINLEHRWLTPHRGLRWVSMTINPSIEHETSRLWHGLMLDVTDRKHAEERLRASQLQLRAALDAGDMGVLEMNLATNQVQMDASGRRLWNFSDDQAQITVQDMLAQVHPDDAQAALDYHQHVCSGPIQYEREYHLQLPGSVAGSVERWVLCRGRVYREEISGALVKVGVMIDTTPQRRMEQQRLHSQKLEAMGVLAGGIAHDFNNLLLAITGNTRLLLADLADTDPRRQSAQEIDKAAARAADLVRRILSFSSVPEPNRVIRPMSLQPMLEEVMGLARAVLPTTVQITTCIAEQLPDVQADGGQLHQVLINLLTNAADAGPSGDARIMVSAQAIQITATQTQADASLQAGRYVRITVSDNGCGMDQATVQRIFNPFYTTKPSGRGTGLGLAIVHGIMRTLGGAVTVSTAVGEGSSFAVYFPVSQQQAAALTPIRSQHAVGQPMHILYVDDEEALVFLMTRTLERMGHKVTACLSPEQAWKLFHDQGDAFDVVVSDMSMPGMTGIELAERVLALKAGLPFIITSGYLDAQDMQRARTIGVRQMILKPNTVEELTEALLAIVPCRQPVEPADVV